MAFHHLHPNCHIDHDNALIGGLSSSSEMVMTQCDLHGMSIHFGVLCGAHIPSPRVEHHLGDFGPCRSIMIDIDEVHYDDNLSDGDLGGLIHQ